MKTFDIDVFKKLPTGQFIGTTQYKNDKNRIRIAIIWDTHIKCSSKGCFSTTQYFDAQTGEEIPVEYIFNMGK